MKLSLVLHPSRDIAADIAADLAAQAAERGHAVIATEEDAERVAGTVAVSEPVGEGADFVVAVGGDGTMLEAARVAGEAGVPVLGINAGHVGFLTEFEPDRIAEALDALESGEFHTSSRMTLTASTDDGHLVTGLNDAVLEKAVSQHLIRIELSVGGERLVEYRADAVVVATPTGSTAYTFSAGGPLVDPELEALVVTAVAPHNLFGRPLVFRPTAQLRLTVRGDRPARLNVDGRSVAELEAGEAITVARGPGPVRFVRRSPANFATAVRDKFRLHDA